MMIAVSIAFVALMIVLPLAMTLTLLASIAVLVRMLLRWLASVPMRLWRSRRGLPEGWWHEFEREFHAYSEPELTRVRQQERRL